MTILQSLREQIDKARRRAPPNLEELAASSINLPPSVMAPRKQLDDRRKFLAETLGDRLEAKNEYERIVEGNELQPINYLQHGTVASRSVCRIGFKVDNQSAWATGFLIAPGVLITNNHVFPAAAVARDARAEFDLELDIYDNPRQPVSFRLRPDRLFKTSSELDYSIVSVEDQSEDGVTLTSFGYLPLVATVGKVADGEWLTIIQHPGGEQKQVCVRENKLLTRTDDVLWYSTDTLGGSSGSPVFNNSWDVVALHHKGVPQMKNGVMQTVDDRDFDPGRDKEEAIKWIANEGIRISRLVADLTRTAPDEPLFEPIFAMTPDRARAVIAQFASAYFTTPAVGSGSNSKATPPATQFYPPARENNAMAARSINVTFDINDDGSVSVRQVRHPIIGIVSRSGIRRQRRHDRHGLASRRLRRAVRSRLQPDRQKKGLRSSVSRRQGLPRAAADLGVLGA